MPKSKNKTHFKIRTVRKSDAIDLITNYFARYDEVKRNPTLGLATIVKKPTVIEEMKWFQNLLRQAQKGNSFMSVAEVNGHIVGACDVVGYDMSEKQHIGVLGIAVTEPYRKQGIGKALIEDVLKRAAKRYSIITLSVFAVNRNAIKLYEKFGFKRFGVLPKGFKRGKRSFDDVRMYREL
jgi:ribosomal protein S18 acetylase RimI-like enzyme